MKYYYYILLLLLELLYYNYTRMYEVYSNPTWSTTVNHQLSSFDICLIVVELMGDVTGDVSMR